MNIRIPEDVLSSEVGDEIVLLNLASGNYFGIVGVAARIWNLLFTEVSIDEIVNTIVREYEVDHDRARKDLTMLVRELAEEGLVTVDCSPSL